MKLAEALQERADLNKKIAQLGSRLQNNALVQEGEKPAENPDSLLKEFFEAVNRLKYIVARINITNSVVKVEGKTLTELIAEKDCLIQQVSILRNLVDSASRTATRASRTEIKILSTVNVRDIQAQIDEFSKQIRLKNNLLQQTNWTVDLIE